MTVIAETVDDLRAHVAAVVDLVEGYWVESPPEGDVLVCPDRYPDGEHRRIEMGDGPMLSEVVRAALADAIRRRMEGES